MWFIGVEVEQETIAPLSKKNPGSAPDSYVTNFSIHALFPPSSTSDFFGLNDNTILL